MQYEPATKIFKIEIAEDVDLCQKASLSILPDMELLTPPEATLTYSISSGSEVQKVSWTDSIVETSISMRFVGSSLQVEDRVFVQAAAENSVQGMS